ncbi:hypothetical protein M404DRAFT_33419 [Pisolithus tinctorius Marx 270]|uniref:Uncharacterized protein n=1 Tax=Pisolithus tinctorius Marx 270 TaxID=870435 RepID=A0A0C3JFI6_PISTI|nr:hypothetical protein M404DRAFT_33419 [Pisolithus tinctorius Marx 270]
MSSQRQNKTPQPTPGHSRDYSQVANDDLVVLTDDSTDTEREKAVEKARRREEAEKKELSGAVYDVNTAQRVPGTSVVVTMTRRPPCTRCIASLMAEENLQLDTGRGGGGTLAEESRDRELLRREEEEDAREGKGESNRDGGSG